MIHVFTRLGTRGGRTAALRAARYLIEPLAGAAIFCMWLAYAPPPTMSAVAVRSDMTVTSPDAVVIGLSFAVALAFSRLSPAITIGIVSLLIAFVAWRLPAWLRSLRPAAAENELSEQVEVAELSALSSRERDIYVWVAQGMTNAEIAKVAHIEESTVKSHITRILTKLQLSSRTAVVAHAYRNGVLVPER